MAGWWVNDIQNFVTSVEKIYATYSEEPKVKPPVSEQSASVVQTSAASGKTAAERADNSTLKTAVKQADNSTLKTAAEIAGNIPRPGTSEATSGRLKDGTTSWPQTGDYAPALVHQHARLHGDIEFRNVSYSADDTEIGRAHV